ncbi:MAG: class I SAM-dependent methyltransferase [Gemmatimonadetes bacterium]|nr:MAG: class I SAM-dependent methyltransferase [Gemmatimonadota bacterium]
MIKNRALFEFWLKEAETSSFAGWDFSYLAGRMVEMPVAWGYKSRILPKIRQVASLLDMGTGGGEFLASLQPLPAQTYATEAYPPNVPIARRRLSPLGVEVIPVEEGSPLPFSDQQFELVINRHEWYAPSEVYRILKPGGEFITQQVGENNDIELNLLLGAPSPTGGEANWFVDTAARALGNVGFWVEQTQTDFTRTRFYDIGAIIYYLKAVPWQVPDFSVEAYWEPLGEIHNRIERDGYLDVTLHRFFIHARRLD